MTAHPDTASTDIVRAAIDLQRFPWHQPVAVALAHDYASVAPFFPGNPADPAAWRDTIARVQAAPRDRARLVSVLERQLAQRGAPGAARDAAAALADPKTVAVVTGQQAGLFGGPLYTTLKALTAIALARRIEQDHGARAVPVFWVEAEDHDWQEVRTAAAINGDMQLCEVELADLHGAGTHPIAALTLDDDVYAVIDRFAASLAPTEFTADLVARLRRRYCPGTTMSAAFAGWIDDLLGGEGLVVFEAADPAAKPAAADLFARELAQPGRTAELVRERARAMRARGFTPQIDPAEDSVALFRLDARGRLAIRRRGSDLVVGDATQSAEATRAEAASHPERFSPNVLLRPLVQDRLFPTVCYVAGPSELVYQAQLGEVYREFGVEAPLLYPRASATILDGAAVRFLERHHLSLEALHDREDTVLNRLLAAEMSPAVEQAFAETETLLGERAGALKEAVATVDATLAGAADTTLERIRETLKNLHGKVLQAARRKDETLRRQFTRTHTLVYPGGQPQERALAGAFFANRHGLDFASRLLIALPLQTDRHYVVTL